MTDPVVIKRGMRVVFKPQWRDPGDDKYTFIAVTDEHPIDHGFNTSTIENTMWIRPIQTGARAYMVESAEPYLPVVTLTFLGLSKKGARVQLRRTPHARRSRVVGHRGDDRAFHVFSAVPPARQGL